MHFGKDFVHNLEIKVSQRQLPSLLSGMLEEIASEATGDILLLLLFPLHLCSSHLNPISNTQANILDKNYPDHLYTFKSIAHPEQHESEP